MQEAEQHMGQLPRSGPESGYRDSAGKKNPPCGGLKTLFSVGGALKPCALTKNRNFAEDRCTACICAALLMRVSTPGIVSLGRITTGF
jgi:hypothetical protein